MTTVAEFATSNYTFTATDSVRFDIDTATGEQALVTVRSGSSTGAIIFQMVVTTTAIYGPFNPGDYLTVYAKRGAVDYTIVNQEATHPLSDYETSVIQSRIPNEVWVTDPSFGAVAGEADSLNGFQAAINSFPSSAECKINVPDGTWNLSATPTIGARRVTWVLSAGASISGAGSLPDSVIQLKRGIQSPKFYSNTSGSVNVNSAGVSGWSTRWLHAQLYAYGASTGTDVLGQRAINGIGITGDAVTLSGAGGMLDGVNFTHAVSAGASGTRNAFHSRIAVVGAVTAAPKNDMVSHLSTGYSTANQGGNGIWTTDPDVGMKGSLWAGNDNVWLASGATYYRGIYGREINVAIQSGASSYAKAGLFIAKLSNDASKAQADDSAVLMGGDIGINAPWKHGVKFGATWGDWPFDSSSILIGCQARTVPVAGPTPVADIGIDMSGVTFSSAAFKSNGFGVKPTGAIYSTPEASATPAVNGEMRFELTSNTQLKIKVKGSDGVVRSASLTLS